MTPIWVFGSGGHAKVVIATIRAVGTFDVRGVLDDDPGRWGAAVSNVPILGAVSRSEIARRGISNAVLAIGANHHRAAVAERLDGAVEWLSVVHPTAHLADGVQIGLGTVVFAGVIVQADTVVGNHVILNTACTVDHDGVINDFVHVAPGTHLAGNVRIGTGTLLGVGSCAIPGAEVGAWSTVGAGAVVVKDIPAGAVAVGVPATCRRQTTDTDQAR
jgi:sugar O-acyltransferase (sialic acid O-acetyltransferase NeuD family)